MSPSITVRRVTVMALLVLLSAAGGVAAAADVKVLSTIAFERVFDQAVPAFDRSSGHQAFVEFGGGTPMADRVRRGEAADVYLGPRAEIDALVAAGRVRADSVVDLARSQVGMAVKQGATRPDISTADALRRTLLASHGVTYPDPASGSPSGRHIVRIAEQLGIADALRAKTRRPAGGGAMGPILLAQGEVDLAVQQNCELLLVPGVELLGPLPPEFQLVTVMSAGVPVAAQEPKAGKAFIQYLQTTAAAAYMQRWGLEPLIAAGTNRSPH